MEKKVAHGHKPSRKKELKPVTTMMAVRVTIELLGFEQLSSSECNKCPRRKTPCGFGIAHGFKVTGCTIPVNVAMAESIAKAITGIAIKFGS